MRKSRLHAGAVARGRSMLEQAVPEGLHAVEGIHAGAGENREEEGVAETQTYGLAASSFAHPPALLGVGEGGGVRNAGMKLILGRRGQWGKGFCFVFF